MPATAAGRPGLGAASMWGILHHPVKCDVRSATISGALVAAALGLAAGAGQGRDYADVIETWRAERERRLTADDGWLTVAGLFFLREGENTFGSDPLHDIVLPPGPSSSTTGRSRCAPSAAAP